MQNHTSHTARLLRRALAFLAIAFGLLAPVMGDSVSIAATDSFDPGITGITSAIAHQPDGKILIAGSFTALNSGAVSRTNLARVDAAGVADTTFDANIASGGVTSIAVQPDGKILLTGANITIGGVARQLTRLNSDGSLDTAFTTPGLTSAQRILLQPDGKILLTSTSAVVGVYNSVSQAGVGRLNADGTRDTSFTPPTTALFGISNLALQQDGKIVYGFAPSGISALKRIGRLNADGSEDTAFNANVTTNLFGGTIGGIAIQSDGRIVFTSGHDLTSIGGRLYINRLNTDGTLDTTWAGHTLTDRVGLTPQNGNSNMLLPQADGKLVVVGRFGSATYIGATRLNVGGSLDTTFAPSFLTSTPSDGVLAGGLIQADGKVIALCNSLVATVNGVARIRIARLTNDAATQTLSTTASKVTWARGGSAPDAYGVYFEKSTDSGATWTRLTPDATRVAASTGDWELPGQALTGSGQLRATAYLRAAMGTGSGTSLAQQTASYSLVTATAPVVTTATQSGVLATSATLGGEVTADGGAAVTDRGIVWNTTGTPTTADTKVANGTGTGVFSATVTGLPAGTTVHVRAYAINSVDTSYGAAISFATPPLVLPTIVTNTLNTGTGSLRQAVLNANANPGADTITFDPTVFATAQTIVLATANFAPFTGDTTVTGPAAGVTVQGVQVAGGVFTVGAGTTASLSKLTINRGASGILNHGTLTASNCGFFQNTYGINNVNTATVTGCSFVEIEYSLYNGVFPVNAAATLTVSDCSFTACPASFISNNGTATMSGCTADDMGNTSGGEATIYNLTGATLTLTNCSLLSTAGSGSGMFSNDGTLAFQNCTLSENAESGNTGTLTLKNTIFRKSPRSGTVDNGNLFIDGGGNLILNNTAGVVGPTASLAADLTTLGLDPTGLQNNGGPTKTFKLLGGAAINGGLAANVPGGVTTDQRGSGFPRSVGTVDIGAYEHPSPVQLVATTASAAEGTGAGTTAFTFTVSRPGATTDAVTVNYAITGTGTNPANAADFGGTLPSGTLTLPIGVASDIITIAVSKDALIETDETFTLTLSAPTANHAIAGNGAVATITNDDVAVPSVLYAEDSIRNRLNSGLGWSSDWTVPLNIAPGLTYPGLNTDGGSVGAVGQTFRTLSTAQTTGTVWVSALVTGGGGYANIGFFSGAQEKLTAGVIYNGSGQGPFYGTFEFSGAGVRHDYSAVATNAATHMMLLAIDLDANQFQMWVDPNLAALGAPAIVRTASAFTGSYDFNRIRLEVTAGARVDEVRVGSDLASIVNYTPPVNNAPYDIAVSPTSFAENNAPGAVVTTVVALDADAEDTHSVALVPGVGDTDNGAFTLSGNSLMLTGSADFETKNSYSVRLRVTEVGLAPASRVARATSAGGLSYERQVTIGVTDVIVPQAINFAALGGKTFGDAPFTVSATGGASGQPVTFSIISGPASIVGDTVTITGAGNVTVRATQAGSPIGEYAAASPVNRTFTVAKAAQAITFDALANKAFGDADFTVSATGGASGQPVTFAISGPATLTGNTVSITGAGEVTITASQAGNTNYLAATDVPRTFNVGKAAQTIAFAPAGTALQTDTVTLSATGGASGNAVTFSLVSGPGSLAGNMLTFTAGGNVVVRASQAGNANYNAATNVDATIVVETVGPVTTGNTYTGLLTDGTGRVRGSFLGRLGPTGFGTVTVWADGKRGSMKVLGETSITIISSGTPMTVNFPAGAQAPSGNPTRDVSVTIGSETIAGVATRSPYETRLRTLSAGKYTFAATSTTGAPKVAAAMFGTINPFGGVRITARLGNGRVATFNSQEQSNGDIAVYCGYGVGGAQSLAGMLSRTSTTAPHFTANLRWTVPAGADARLSAGVDADYDTVGARYTPGAVNSLLALDPSKRIALGLEIPTLTPSVKSYTFPMTANVIAFVTTRPYSQIRFFPATGMFSGTTSYDFVQRNFYGVLLQGEDLNYGVGYLQDTNALGTVTIDAELPQ